MIAFLTTVLLLGQPADADRIAALIRDLDADELEVRDRSARELTAAGEAALPALRKLLADPPSEEVGSLAPAIIGAIEREIRRKAFKGGPPQNGLAARVTAALQEDGTVLLTAEIMNLDPKPVAFIPVLVSDLTAPLLSLAAGDAQGAFTVRRVPGTGRSRGKRCTIC